MPRLLILAAFVLGAVAAPAEAQETPSDQPAREEAAPAAAHAYFPDVPLTDQHGVTKRFYSDLMKGHTVLIHAFFSACEAACPATTKNLQAIQTALGDRLGKDVRILSITLDPAADTPARMAAHAETVGARSGWSFLTGSPMDVQTTLSKLGLWVDDKEAHGNVLLMGNEPTGLWKKAMGLGDPEELSALMLGVANDRGEP